MSKDNKVDELLLRIRQAYTEAHAKAGGSAATIEDIVRTENSIITEAKAALLKLISEEVIAKRDMTFNNTYPVFSSLEEYMEHVATVREVQRKEQKLALERLFGDE